MLSIRIDDEKTIVKNATSQSQWTNKTSVLFGIIYASLQKNFPDFNRNTYGDHIAARIIKKLQGQTEDNSNYLFHVPENGDTLFFIEQFIDGRETVSPTLDEVEELRISNFMTANFLPSRGCIQFENLRSMRHVIIALLYFYAANGYKLTRCKHCGRWFAVKTLKEIYCSRKSLFPGYEEYSCGAAVKIIKDKLEKKRIAEYERLRQRSAEYGVYSNHNKAFISFCETCDDYKAKLKKGASIELLQSYMDFLYDSKYVRPKYERIKNY